MALVAWYPLNGDTLDYSGNDYGAINNGASIDTNGKIGRCYSFDGVNNYIQSDITSYTSMSFWLYYNSEQSADQYPTFFNQKQQSSNGQFLWMAMAMRGTVGAKEFFMQVGNNGYNTMFVPGLIDYDKWIHLTFIFNIQENKILIYKNGGLFITLTPSVSSKTPTDDALYIGTYQANSSYCFAGKMNDIRFYDHMLSLKEIKELSKAKILHYTFDRFEEPTNNYIYFQNPRIDNSYNSYIMTTAGTWQEKHPDAIRVYNIDNEEITGYVNGGVTDYTNTYHAIWTYDEGLKKPVVIMRDYDGIWKAKSFSIKKTWNSLGLGVGDKYCISWLQWTDTPGKSANTGIYAYNSSGDRNFWDGQSISQSSSFNTKINTWQRVYAVFTISSVVDLSADLNIYMYGHYQSRGILKIADVQLELKDHATPFVNGSRSGTIYDSSGYDNHAELALATTPQWVEEGKVGTGAYLFDGSSRIITGRLFEDDINQCHTVSAWVYPTNSSATGNQQLVNFNQGYRLYHTANGQSLMYINSGTNDHYVYAPVIPENQWTLVTWIYDKNNLICKAYYNGELIASSNNFNSTDLPYGFTNNTIFGDNFYGLIDDLRIYATALSAEDIKELYSSRASLDSHGNLTVYKAEVFKEEETKSGERVVFEDAWDYEVQSMLVEGNSEQVVTVQGKNLIDKEKIIIGIVSSITGDLMTTIIGYRTPYLPVSPSTNYYLSGITNYDNHFVAFYGPDKSYLSRTYGTSITGRVITTPSGCSYAILTQYRARIADATGQMLLELCKDTLQLELGSVATAYEPFIPDSPSPDYPSPVNSAGECNLVSRGKNMLDTRLLMDPAKYNIPAWYDGAYKAIAIPFPNGTYSFSTFWPAGFKEEFEAGTTPMVLTVTTYIDTSSNAPGIYAHITGAYANKNIMRALNVTDGFIYFAGYAPGLTTQALQWFYDNVKIQIEPGSVATEYEPFRGYNESPLPILRKIGDVADSYNPVTGEYVQRIGVKVFDGTEGWVRLNDIRYLLNSVVEGVSAPSLPTTGYCTHFKVVSGASNSNILINQTGWQIQGNLFFGAVEIFSTVEAWKAYLAAQYAAGTPVTVYYQLAEPIITYLDPVTIPTFAPYTVIETDGIVQPTITATAFTYGG